MTITLRSKPDLDLAISINGTEFKTEKIVIEKSQDSYFNTNPLLKKVNEYQDKGWELMSLTALRLIQLATLLT